MEAFEESPNDLENLVLHPPPYNLISMIMIPVLPSKNARMKASQII